MNLFQNLKVIVLVSLIINYPINSTINYKICCELKWRDSSSDGCKIRKIYYEDSSILRLDRVKLVTYWNCFSEEENVCNDCKSNL